MANLRLALAAAAILSVVGSPGLPIGGAARAEAPPSTDDAIRAPDRRGGEVSLEEFYSATQLATPGFDITAGLQEALAVAQARGRAVSLPSTPPAAGYWTVSTTITLGDGSTSAASTKGGMRIEGAGSGGLFGTRGTYLRWGGPAGGTMIAIRGPIENVQLRGLNLNGADSAARLIQATAVRFSAFEDIFGAAFTGVGLGFYGAPKAGDLNVMVRGGGLYLTTGVAGAIALEFDGVLADSTDTWLSTFENSRFETLSTADATGSAIRLGMSDNILFSQVHAICRGTVSLSGTTTAGSNRVTAVSTMTGYGVGRLVTGPGIPAGTYITAISGATLTLSRAATITARHGGLNVRGAAVLFDASGSGTGGNSFPTGHLFVKSAIDSVGVIEDGRHTIGTNNFIDFGTTDNEILPVHPKLKGTTDQGYSFGGYGGPTYAPYAPALTASSPGGMPPTFSNASFRYAVSGRTLTINGVYTVAARGSAAGAILIPLPDGITSSGLQAVTVGNATVGAAWYGVTQGAFLKVGLPTADGQTFVISATVDF